jgi:hypothetical protein
MKAASVCFDFFSWLLNGSIHFGSVRLYMMMHVGIGADSNRAFLDQWKMREINQPKIALIEKRFVCAAGSKMAIS